MDRGAADRRAVERRVLAARRIDAHVRLGRAVDDEVRSRRVAAHRGVVGAALRLDRRVAGRVVPVRRLRQQRHDPDLVAQPLEIRDVRREDVAVEAGPRPPVRAQVVDARVDQRDVGLAGRDQHGLVQRAVGVAIVHRLARDPEVPPPRGLGQQRVDLRAPAARVGRGGRLGAAVADMDDVGLVGGRDAEPREQRRRHRAHVRRRQRARDRDVRAQPHVGVELRPEHRAAQRHLRRDARVRAARERIGDPVDVQARVPRRALDDRHHLRAGVDVAGGVGLRGLERAPRIADQGVADHGAAVGELGPHLVDDRGGRINEEELGAADARQRLRP